MKNDNISLHFRQCPVQSVYAGSEGLLSGISFLFKLK